LFHHKKHPKEMAAAKVKAFLTHLAADGLVSASTQNQAFIFPLIPAFSLWSRGNLAAAHVSNYTYLFLISKMLQLGVATEMA
jgi:hypothetical protein